MDTATDDDRVAKRGDLGLTCDELLARFSGDYEACFAFLAERRRQYKYNSRSKGRLAIDRVRDDLASRKRQGEHELRERERAIQELADRHLASAHDSLKKSLELRNDPLLAALLPLLAGDDVDEDDIFSALSEMNRLPSARPIVDAAIAGLQGEMRKAHDAGDYRTMNKLAGEIVEIEAVRETLVDHGI